MVDRIPPHDIEAERAVLGSILLKNDVIGQVASIVGVESFYAEKHRILFQAMKDLHDIGEPLDAVTIGSSLVERKMLARAGGSLIFSELLSETVTSANVEHYAHIVRKKAAVRDMIVAAQDVVAKGYSGVENVEDYLTEARTAITTAASGVFTKSGPVMLEEGMDGIIDDVLTGTYPKGLVRTGIGDLDLVTGGLWPGLMTVLAGRPSMGKSAAALNIGINAALQGKKVLYVTLEDVHYFVVLRSLARFGNMDYQKLVLRDVKDVQQAELKQAGMKIKGLPFWVSDASGTTASNIRQVVASHANRYGLDLLVVDHLAEIDGVGENETAVVTNAARSFRDCAKELNVPVLMVHQLNRNVEHRNDKRPTLSDLRQSGAIEAVARSVWFAFRPHYYNEDADKSEFQLIIAKANHGRTGTVKLWCDLSRMYICDRSAVSADDQSGGPRVDPSLGSQRLPREVDYDPSSY